MSDADLVAPAPAASRASTPAAKAARVSTPDQPAVGSRAATFGLYARIGLSVARGIGIMFWPYDAKCGAGLAAYLAAVAVVIVSGVWSAIGSWRHRAARLHILSYLLRACG